VIVAANVAVAVVVVVVVRILVVAVVRHLVVVVLHVLLLAGSVHDRAGETWEGFFDDEAKSKVEVRERRKREGWGEWRVE